MSVVTKQHLFTQGNLLYIQDYRFEDGNGQRNKYMLVVFVDEATSVIIRALPTSHDHVPDDKLNHGCTNNEVFSFFMFKRGRAVCENGFAFARNTFVYFQQNLLQTAIASLQSYPREQVELKGRLTEAEFNRFIKCLKASRHVPRGILRKINEVFPNRHK